MTILQTILDPATNTPWVSLKDLGQTLTRSIPSMVKFAEKLHIPMKLIKAFRETRNNNKGLHRLRCISWDDVARISEESKHALRYPVPFRAKQAALRYPAPVIPAAPPVPSDSRIALLRGAADILRSMGTKEATFRDGHITATFEVTANEIIEL